MPKPTKTANELPRARVRFCAYSQFSDETAKEQTELFAFPCAVIPTRTAKEAKAIAAFFNLTEEERAERIASCIDAGWGYPNPKKAAYDMANDALDLITGRGK